MNKSITSILALAVTTSLAFANGGEGEKKKNPYSLKNSGWTPGSGVTVIDDDAMSMNIAGRIQAGYQYTDWADDSGLADESTFDVERARVKFSGHIVNEHLTYLLQLEATSDDDNVKDAWAHWNFMNNEGNHIGIRLGQGKSYYGLEASGTSSALWFVDRSLATQLFSNVRSTGAIFTGHHMENKLRWSAGLQNGTVAAGAADGFGDSDSSENEGTQLNFVAHVNFDPFGDMMNGGSNLNFKQGDLAHNGEMKATVGLGYAMGNNTFQETNEAIDSTSVNVNTAWRFGNGFSAQAEFYGREDEASSDPLVPGPSNKADADGYYAQVGYSLAHNPDAMVQWGFGLRYSMTDLQGNDAGGPTFILSDPDNLNGTISDVSVVATAFYTGHNAKTQIQYSMGEIDPDEGDSTDVDQISVLFTLVF